MAGRRIISCILLGGILLFAVASICHPQDLEKNLLDVKMPQPEPTPNFLPASKNMPLQGPVEAAKPDKQASQSWYLHLLNGIAMGLATYNTQEQNDGRPPFAGTPR